jgi:DNA-binding CsgD family transcriptional regulator
MEDRFLDKKDVRAMVRLLGDTCLVEGSINQKKKFLMAGLCELLDIQAWAWVHAVEMTPGKLPVYVAYIHGGFSEEILPAFVRIQSHPDMAFFSTTICRELIGRTGPISRTLQQIVDLKGFATAEVARDWKACGIDPRLLFFYPLADGTFSGLAIYRSTGKPLFTEREARMAHILLSEVPWLHERQGAEAEQAIQVPQLPRQQRLVLELLLQGCSRKTIASTMNVSINTIAGYAKKIYAYFGVTSHAQLINRFFLGNGGEVG